MYVALCGTLLSCVPSPALARHRHAALAALAASPTPGSPLVDGRPVSTVLRMTATAYTAYCGGRCSGRTALGWQAGYGIVAVDPRVIPLRTRLYIPGYGYAVAGDTGGSIRGSRIDLGFNTYRDARQFGRRDILVYILQ
jgi:3D (Asp-Asp-Asp) domain-containing protein